MEAVFDVLIHVEGLRNIDLFRQGLYALRFYLYALDPKARRWKGEESTATKNSEEKKKLAQYERWKRRDFEGIPYHIIRDLNPTKKEVESTMLSESERESRAVEIHSDQACFATKAFKIQFIEQVVSIKEGCHFRLKMPVAIMSKLLVYFDCELMFKEYHSSE